MKANIIAARLLQAFRSNPYLKISIVLIIVSLFDLVLFHPDA